MAFIGNTNTTQAFIPAVDFFSGNASTTAFTLSKPVASVAQVQVVVNNVAQNPSSAYTVSGNTITFTSAPSSGTNNIYVYYTSPITQVIAPGQGTVNTASLSASLLVPPAMVSDQDNTSTGYFDLPVGTTAQRPASPTVGMIRYNTTESKYEVYNGSFWQYLTATTYPYNIDYLVVAGGGGGSGSGSGGGGAGGFRTATGFTLAPGTSYTVTVGAGGAGVSGGTAGTGSNSVFSTITSNGGGAAVNRAAGSAGGSGAGGGALNATYYAGGAGNTPSTSPSQGNTGGSAGGGNFTTGGGGGSGAVGVAGASGQSGAGGAGTASSITGSSVTYAGGGGGGGAAGGAGTASGGAGGSGGGGAGGSGNAGNGTAGTANTGGGGGAGVAANTDGVGAAGGSGVVILSIPTTNYSGTTTGSPTVTTSGSNTILKYTGSGTYTA